MSGVNKQIAVGHVGNSEFKVSDNGTKRLAFSIAVNEVWYDSNTKEKRERVEWINCVMFGPRAESVSQYVTKGKQVYVEGRQQTRKWEKDGATHYRTECIVNDLQLLGSGGGKSKDAQSQGGGGGDEYSGGAPSDDEIPFLYNESSSLSGERWRKDARRKLI